MNKPTIVEVRVISHHPTNDYVAVIFSDGTSSTFDEPFQRDGSAETFARGFRAALAWQAE